MMQVVLDLPAVGLLRWELARLILQLWVSLWVSFIYIFIIEISDCLGWLCKILSTKGPQNLV